MSEHDYSAPGAYFITVCLHDRRCCLGQIHDGVMKLNEYGRIVFNQWEWLHRQYDYLMLDGFVVMPNHFHAVLVIANFVGNGRDRSLPDAKIKPVPELVGAFKTASSKLIHRTGLVDFRWQKSYYDHIVRNERELFNIRNYIDTNPARWAMDVENWDNANAANGRDAGDGGDVGNGRDRSLHKISATFDEMDRYYRSIPGGR